MAMGAGVGAALGHVVIVGISTRALAESAVRAGYACTTVDAFGDLDQRAHVRNLALLRDCHRPYTAAAAVALAQRLPAEAAVYGANLENHPAAVRRLGAGRRLLGNEPASLAGARDPWKVATVVRAAGSCFPRSLRPDDSDAADPALPWLRKPRRGGGGSGVAAWRPGDRLRAHEMLQRRIDGVPASALFAADGRRAVLLGLTRQLVGEPDFGAGGFRFCGNLFPLDAAHPDPDRLHDRLRHVASAVTSEFRLRGLCGIDFVLRDGTPWVLEVNPRPTAAMELLERSLGLSVFDTHVGACLGELPSAAAPVVSGVPGVSGKAIVFASRDVTLPDTRPWLARDDVRDLPFPGERIRRGHPVCTVFGQGETAAACRAALVRTTAAITQQIHAAFAGATAGADL